MLGWIAQSWPLAGMDEMAFYETLVEKMNTCVLLQMGQQVPAEAPWQGGGKGGAPAGPATAAPPAPAAGAPAATPKAGPGVGGKGDGKAGGMSGGTGDGGPPAEASQSLGDGGHGDGGDWWQQNSGQDSWQNWHNAPQAQDWQDFCELQLMEQCTVLFLCFLFLFFFGWCLFKANQFEV